MLTWKDVQWSLVGIPLLIFGGIFLYEGTSMSSKVLDIEPEKIGAVIGLINLWDTLGIGFIALGLAVISFGFTYAVYNSSNRHQLVLANALDKSFATILAKLELRDNQIKDIHRVISKMAK